MIIEEHYPVVNLFAVPILIVCVIAQSILLAFWQNALSHSVNFMSKSFVYSAFIITCVSILCGDVALQSFIVNGPDTGLFVRIQDWSMLVAGVITVVSLCFKKTH
jgi:hypothetical protein